MTAADVIDIYSTLGGLGVQIWVDGGWGVDALLGTQTRPQKDLDLALELQHLARFEQFFASRGYRRTKREIERPFNFVLANRAGREIDVHAISLDENGNGIYGFPENGLMYPADSLAGTGTISGVSCGPAVFRSGFNGRQRIAPLVGGASSFMRDTRVAASR